ncbi:MAG TPA: hypothetical protein PLD47_17315 [Aggregatilineales bacterium]|nr:hypothetical protein [Anaerolineales bacterium]HRE49488.1 hypothetical protein [Aggregatilineales bacterium]
MNTFPPRTVIAHAGYRRERLPGEVVAMRLLDARRETLDTWFADCHKVMSAWRPGRRLRYLHDIRGAERVTPYATDKVIRVLRQMRYLPVTDGRGAILLTNDAVAALLASFFKRRPYANWHIHFFTAEEDALRWLREGAPEGNPAG